MRSFFMFNGKSSADYGLTLEYLPDAAFPERRGESYQIVGRNGTQYREDGTFENYEQTYKVWIRDALSYRDVYQISNDVANWLLGSSGYCRLEDTYNPESFRLARFAGSLDFQTTMLKYGRATLVFDCLPQRYLKSGEVVFETDGTALTLNNPTGFTASPLIRVTGSGTVGIGVSKMVDGEAASTLNIKLGIGSSEKTVVLDSAAYTAQVNGVDVDDGIQFSGIPYATFPKFESGQYEIAPLTGESYTGTISTIEVVPRWWAL